MEFSAPMFSVPQRWIIYDCFIPTLLQGIHLVYPILASSLLLRICVLWMPLQKIWYDSLSTILGFLVLWWYYEMSIVFFILLPMFVYVLLFIVPRQRGVAVGGACVIFIVVCELFIVSAVEWHKIRGSLLVVVMKLISLSFDIDASISLSEKKSPPSTSHLPDFISYLSYSVFPATTIFGPYTTYDEHLKYTAGVKMSLNWLFNVIRGLVLATLCLSMSMCVFPFLFEEPLWNKWLAAYSTAASFRYSHYYVVLMSESSTLLVGLGFVMKSAGNINWNGYRTIQPSNIEIPRSLGSVVTSWNLPMHHFLKNYVFKPSRLHVGRFGAVLITYIASAMLHGLNFQLGAVLLSTGIYAYIESVLRYKLSKHLNACIMDRSCSSSCQHKYKETVPWVAVINFFFTLLAMFHLAYLGVMFGGSEDDAIMEEGYSMMHTLKKWRNLDFLSHWIALGTWIITFIL